MSHFSVMVFGKNIEEQLAPYEESTKDKRFIAFVDEEDDYRKQYETESTTRVVMPDGRLLLPWDDAFKKPGAIGVGSDTHGVPANLEKREVPYKETYAAFEAFMDDWCGYEQRDPEKGRYGRWTNVNAKWDWYQIGGRWEGFFTLKRGRVPANQAKKEDIDVEAMCAEAEKKAREQYQKVAALYPDGIIPKIKVWAEYLAEVDAKTITIDDARKAYHDQDAVKACDEAKILGFFGSLCDYQVSEDEYAQLARASAIVPFAVVKDGKWYEKGDMGWWGMVSGEKKQSDWNAEVMELFEATPDEELITIVDCHI